MRLPRPVFRKAREMKNAEQISQMVPSPKPLRASEGDTVLVSPAMAMAVSATTAMG